MRWVERHYTSQIVLIYNKTTKRRATLQEAHHECRVSFIGAPPSLIWRIHHQILNSCVVEHNVSFNNTSPLRKSSTKKHWVVIHKTKMFSIVISNKCKALDRVGLQSQPCAKKWGRIMNDPTMGRSRLRNCHSIWP